MRLGDIEGHAVLCDWFLLCIIETLYWLHLRLHVKGTHVRVLFSYYANLMCSKNLSSQVANTYRKIASPLVNMTGWLQMYLGLEKS